MVIAQAAICDGSVRIGVAILRRVATQTPPSATGHPLRRRHLRRVTSSDAAICDGSAVVGTASAVEREVTPDLHRVREQ